jgi:hypothetical protein
MLANSVIGGVALAIYLTILVLYLNPRFPLADLPALAGTLILSYGVHMAVAFYVLIVLREIVATDVASPGWISVRFLIWLGSLSATGGAFLMWANLRGFRAVLDEVTVRRLTAGALGLSVCAAALVALAIAHSLSRKRHSRLEAGVLAVLMMASVAVPMMLRGPGIGSLPKATWPEAALNLGQGGGDARVTVLLFEGASLDIIAPAAAEGRLPHFARLLDSGASMHVATLRPTQPGTVWTAAATGKMPFRNGIRSAARYWPLGSSEALEMLPDFCFAHALVRFGFLRQQVHSSFDRAARPVWNILGSQGLPVGVVNWSITQPARAVRGFIVSDEFVHLLSSSVALEGAGAVSPRAAAAAAASAAGAVSGETAGSPISTTDPLARQLAPPCRADRIYERVAAELARVYRVRFMAVRFECLDGAGHYLLRYAMPRAFGDVSDAELQRYGSALLGYYSEADAVIGRAIDALRPGDMLMVVSGFGMEPMSMWKRLLERVFGSPAYQGTHERAPDGFFLAFGTPIRPGRYPRGSITDFAPTVLYALGFPVARDMDGHARTDIFQPSLTAGRPITFIPTYEARMPQP